MSDIFNEFGQHECSVCGTDCCLVEDMLDDNTAKIRALQAEIARLKEGLRECVGHLESIHLTLVHNLREPERTAFWEAVNARIKTERLLNDGAEALLGDSDD